MNKNCIVLFAIILSAITTAGCVQEKEKIQPDYIAFIAMGPGNSILVLDLSEEKFIGRLQAGVNPRGIAVSRDGGLLFAASFSTDKIAVINVSKKEVITTLNMRGTTYHATTNPSDGRIFFTKNSQNLVGIINPKTFIETGQFFTISIPTGNYPNYVSSTPDGKFAYASNMGSDDVSVLDAADNLPLKEIKVGKRPDHLVVSPDARYVYVANSGDGTVSVIDTSTNEVIKNIGVGENPQGIDVTPGGRKIYVANSGSTTLSVIDSSTLEVVKNIEVGEGPGDIAILPDGKLVIVSLQNAKKVVLVDAEKDEVKKELEVDTPPYQIAISQAGIFKPPEGFDIHAPLPKQVEALTVADLWRYDGGVVEVEMVFMNPLTEEKEDGLVFYVYMNSHELALSEYKLDQLATFRNSEGFKTSEGFTWEPQINIVEHHVGGMLTLKKEGLLTNKTEYIIVELRDIGGKDVRSFKWEGEIIRGLR